ncbi:hypothetical protein LAJLEIBI_02929 [[Clostridium] hylemonae DSM 15053]|uniref:hypothetical protein n=1 Tax=[Clostridium] hylemonae TaxID=89153 RepID=UPI0011EF01A9|nr:hypothetical protein [[Clostridium] hylemonae]QEK18906.1 hypothetical protein LAJLEIBI_02929 [[Clostridium] hylemonae DSM 15053]
MEKCGIITLYHKNYNYGGILQAYAMVKIMGELGYDAEIIDYCQSYKALVIHKITKLRISEMLSIFKRKLGLKVLNILFPEIKKGIKGRYVNFEKFMEKIPHSVTYSEKILGSVKIDTRLLLQEVIRFGIQVHGMISIF